MESLYTFVHNLMNCYFVSFLSLPSFVFLLHFGISVCRTPIFGLIQFQLNSIMMNYINQVQVKYIWESVHPKCMRLDKQISVDKVNNCGLQLDCSLRVVVVGRFKL